MSGPDRPWQPDPSKLGNHWQSMFETRRTDVPPLDHPAATTGDAVNDADIPHIDVAEYRPWILQRGRSHAAMMLALRRFDAKSGLWHGWSMAYPSLYAIEHIGDRMVTLDFGARQFALEGRGLDTLADHLQQGGVLSILEYASTLWPTAGAAVVTAIRRLDPERG